METMKRRSALLVLALIVAGCGGATGSVGSTQPAMTPLPAVEEAAAPEAAVSTTTTSEVSPSTSAAPTTTIPTAPTTTLPPVFEYEVAPVSADLVHASWRDECPLHFDQLSLLILTHWNFDGEVVRGPMIVNTAVVPDVVEVFADLFDIGFPIERIQLVDDYGGDDRAAMRANVTSGFNCRFVDGTDRWSNHAFGLAIDINPLINPWAREGNVLPVEGEAYTDRGLDLPGMINLGDEAITIFEEVGWSWGGVWQSADYMHFSKPGN